MRRLFGKTAKLGAGVLLVLTLSVATAQPAAAFTCGAWADKTPLANPTNWQGTDTSIAIRLEEQRCRTNAGLTYYQARMEVYNARASGKSHVSAAIMLVHADKWGVNSQYQTFNVSAPAGTYWRSPGVVSYTRPISIWVPHGQMRVGYPDGRVFTTSVEITA